MGWLAAPRSTVLVSAVAALFCGGVACGGAPEPPPRPTPAEPTAPQPEAPTAEAPTDRPDPSPEELAAAAHVSDRFPGVLRP